LPDLFEVVVLALELGEFFLDQLQALLRSLVLFLLHGLALDLELDHAAVELVHDLGLGVDLHLDARGGLVDQVDRLGGQEAVGDVAVREFGRGDDRRVGDVDAVVDLVLLLQTAQDGDGRLHRRLFDQHLLEAALERGVLLDVLAVFVERGGADAVQLATGERGLQHVARVHRALGLAGADHGVELVDEEDDAALVLGDLLQHRLQALLEFATVLGTGEQRRHVERQHALALERLGHLVIDDALRQAFDDRGLAHARLADQHRVVLGAALQDLDGAADLVVAADHRVELAAASALGEVHAVFIQRLALAFGVLAADIGTAAHRLDRGFERLAVEAALLEQAAGLALVVGEREQEHLAGDELVAALLRLAVGDVEQVVEVAADADLAAVTFDLGQAADRFGNRSLERRHIDAGALQQRYAAAVVLLEQRLHHVQRLDE